MRCKPVYYVFFYYNMLWHYFGNVPFYLENLSEPPYTAPQYTADQVYASVQQFFQTGAFAVSSALLIPIVLGEAWKYAAVMLGSGLIALVLLLVVRRTRPAALAAAEAEELAEDELRIKPTKLS